MKLEAWDFFCEALLADLLFAVLLSHADLKYLLCLHRNANTPVGALSCHSFPCTEVFLCSLLFLEFPHHCSTSVHLVRFFTRKCDELRAMQCRKRRLAAEGWVHSVAARPTCRMCPVHGAELSPVLNDSWAAYTACLQTFEYSCEPRPRAVSARLPLSRKMCHGRCCRGWKCCWTTLKCVARLRSDLLEGDLKVFVYIAMGHGEESRPSGT